MIGRNEGRSSVAAAAYRSGECLTNEYDGIQHDFTKKNWVEYSRIILPDNAPKAYSDRSALWNAVEMAEKSKDAQLCREFEVSLPGELTREQQIEVVEKFVKEKLVSQGMIADINIHNPPVTNDRHQPIDKDGNVTKDTNQMIFKNPHAHILATVRPMDENGVWEKKSEKEYLCKKDGVEKGFTASEFKKAQKEGWEKQYKYLNAGNSEWLTAEEGKVRELERVSRSPRTSPFGRKNPTVEYWNSKSRIFEWRSFWEEVVNEKFESINSDVRIDSRSFKEQGREDEIPTIHMGASATNIEKRVERELREGKTEAQVIHSDIGNINKQIKEHNKFVRELKSRFDEMVNKAKDFVSEVSTRLESIRARIIGNSYEEAVLVRKYNIMASKLTPEGGRLDEYKIATDNVKNANDESADKIRRLQKEIKECSPLQFTKKNSLQAQVREEQEAIEIRKEYLSNISRMYGYSSDDEYRQAKKEYNTRRNEYKRLGLTIEGIKKDTETIVAEYEDTMSNILKKEMEDVAEKRSECRPELEAATQGKLREKYNIDFDEKAYEDAQRKADKMLGEKNESRKVHKKEMSAYRRQQ